MKATESDCEANQIVRQLAWANLGFVTAKLL